MQARPLNITLVEPIWGVSSQDIFRLQIRVNESSELCKYSNKPVPFDQMEIPQTFFTASDDGFTHTIEEFKDLQGSQNTEKTIYVKCRTKTGNVNNDTPVNFTLMVDASPPDIKEGYASPEYIIETLFTQLSIRSDDKVRCRFDDREARYPFMKYEFYPHSPEIFRTFNTRIITKDTTPNIADQNSYSFFAACQNRAGLETSYVQINFSTNLKAPNKILSVMPSGYVNSTDVVLQVETNRDATCYYGDTYAGAFPQEDSKLHVTVLNDLTEQPYEIPIKCEYTLWGMDGYAKADFLIDISPPENLSIAASTRVCGNKELKAAFSADDLGGIAYFRYKVVDEKNATILKWKNTNQEVREDGLDLDYNLSYYWVVQAFDKIGNTIEKKQNFTVYPKDSPVCTPNYPPIGRVMITKNHNGLSINFTCIDPDGYCVKKEYAIIKKGSLGCQDCRECRYQIYYNSLSGITYNGTFCYRVTDNLNASFASDKRFIFEADKPEPIPPLPPSRPEKNDTTDKDSDGDGLPDKWEKAYGLNPNNINDGGIDSDQDGLTNLEEYNVRKIFGNATNPKKPDTDEDKHSDGEEMQANPRTNPLDPLSYPKTVLSPDGDEDGDGITNNEELECGLDPEVADADKNNDGDKLSNKQECICKTSPNVDDSEDDEDGDGLTNREECLNTNTNLFKADTDGDGFTDKQEIDMKSDPLDKNSVPKSHTISFVLIFLGALLLLAGGAIVLIAPTKKTPSISPAQSRQLSTNTHKDLSPPSFPPMRQTPPISQVPHVQPIAAPSAKPLDMETLRQRIVEKRKLLKQKRRDSLFKEFDEGEKLKPVKPPHIKKPPKPIPKKLPKPKHIKPFDRLLDIVTRSVAYKNLTIIVRGKNQDEIERIAKEEEEKELAREKKLAMLHKGSPK